MMLLAQEQVDVSGDWNVDPWSALTGAVTLLSFIVAVVCIVLMVLYQRKNVLLYRQRFSYSWNEIIYGVEKVHDYLRRRRFTPDVIVTFTGAAGVFANLFVLLSKRRIPCFQVMLTDLSEPWESAPPDTTMRATTRHRMYIPNALGRIGADNRVLVIDAACVTGTNGDGLLAFLREAGVVKVQYVCMLRVKPVHEIVCQPTFFVFDNPTTEWYWPWGKGR